MRNKLLRVALGTSAAFAAGSLGLGSYITRIPRQSLSEALEWQRNHYDISWLDAVPQEPYTVPSWDGYELHAVLLRCADPDSRRWVILTHGYTDNRWGSLKYAKMYLDWGWNCILWDMRGHGANTPARCTYGITESQDLAELIKDTRKRWGEDITLGLHGESLGAATTIAALQYSPEVDFAVADCPFADIVNVLEGRSHPLVVQWSSLGARLRCGHSLTEMRPIDALKHSWVPLLLIHGEKDSFISPENSRRLYEAAQGVKELHIIEGAEHAQSILTAPEEYRSIVSRFLRQVTAPVPTA